MEMEATEEYMEMDNSAICYQPLPKKHERILTQMRVQDEKEFMTLPREVQARILMELPKQCLKQARQVCRSWCDIIDSNLGFSIVVDDAKHDYTDCPFPPWKITSCFVSNLTSDVTLDFATFPDSLRKLSIMGAISLSNFQGILTKTTKLKELNLANDVLHKENMWMKMGGGCRINLSHLQKLTIFSHQNIIFLHENLLGIFSLSMPNLTKLKVTIEDGSFNDHFVISEEEVSIAVAFARFLCSLSKLKILHVTINPYLRVDDINTDRILQRINYTHDFEKDVSKIRLNICRLNVSPSYLKLFRRLFTTQDSLKELRIQSPYSQTSQLPYNIMETSVQLSVQSLVAINLQWLSGFPDNQRITIDFHVFSLAKSLKRLIMKRHRRHSEHANISNLHHIPPCLERLEIHGFECLSTEICQMAESTHKLAFVTLIDAGIGGEFGVNGMAAKKIALKNSIQVMKLGPLVNTATDIEDKEYEYLRSRFNNATFQKGRTVTFNLEQYRRNLSLLEVVITEDEDSI